MINVYEKKNGAVRRSFVLPAEIVQALEQIQIAQGFENISDKPITNIVINNPIPNNSA